MLPSVDREHRAARTETILSKLSTHLARSKSSDTERVIDPPPWVKRFQKEKTMEDFDDLLDGSDYFAALIAFGVDPDVWAWLYS